jgi:diguanylate cyclase (GGDEF)-like protein
VDRQALPEIDGPARGQESRSGFKINYLNGMGADGSAVAIMAGMSTSDPSLFPPPSPGRVLVVDDSRVVRAVVARALKSGNYDVREADSGTAALKLLAREPHDVVITDLRMPGLDGFELLAQVKRLDPDVEVIVLTGSHAKDVSCAVRALRLGAHDYLAKPPASADEVLLTVERALEKKRLKDSNRRLLQELQHMSRRDPLTGVLNRRSLDEALGREIARARRHGHALSVMILDLDHFKQVNDTYGHPGGDEVLRAFARVVGSRLREEDVLYRYGGEEFLAVLPETDPQGALAAAERVVAAVAETPVPVAGTRLRVTVSVGVAALSPSVADAAELVARADEALYAAKSGGRNRAVMASPRRHLRRA